ncbi:MAG: T9SS type A sorting domain-containing protein, partial [Cytophagales bacterium]
SIQQITSTHISNKTNLFHQLNAGKLKLNSHLNISGGFTLSDLLDGDIYDISAITATTPTAIVSSGAVIKTKNTEGLNGLFALANPTLPNNLSLYFNGSVNQNAGTKMPSQLAKLFIQNSGTINQTVTLNQDLQVNDSLVIESGTLTYSEQLSGNANLKMNGGVLDIKKTGSIEPSISGIIALNSGKIVFSVTGNQTIRALEYHNLEIAGSGTKTISSSDTLKINNELLVSNTSISASGSTIVFQKSGDLDIPGGFAYNHLLLKNGGVKKLSSDASILPTGIVNLQQTTFDLDNKTLFLQSDANHTAALGKIKGSSSLNNASNFTIQQFFNAKTGSRYISAPVHGMTFNQWKDSVVILGPASGGFDSPNISNNSTLRFFDETHVGTFKNSGWKPVLNLNNTLEIGKGYSLIYSRKKPSNTLGNVRLNSKGIPQIGFISLPVTFSNNITDGYNLVSNPYPCAIDWDSPNITKNNLDNAIYRWDVNIGASGAYYSYVNGVPSDGRTNPSIIPANQAFFIRANAASPILQMNEDAKFTSASNSSSRVEPHPFLLRLKLESNENQDYAVVYATNNKNSSNFCAQNDAVKFNNPSLNLWTSNAQGIQFSIQSLKNENIAESMLPIQFSSQNTGRLKLSVESLQNMTAFTPYIYSESANEFFKIEESSQFELNINQEKDLYLVFKSEETLSETEQIYNKALKAYPNPFQNKLSIFVSQPFNESQLMIMDMNKQIVFKTKVQSGINRFELSGLKPGVYLLELEKNGFKTYQKLVKQ